MGAMIIGDIIGLISTGYILSVIVIITCTLALSVRHLRAILVSISLGLLLGGSLGISTHEAKKESYQKVADITWNFSLKGDITLTISSRAYKKERSWVYVWHIHTFANFDTFAKWQSNHIWKAENSVEEDTYIDHWLSLWQRWVSPTIFLEVPSNLDITPWDILEVRGKIRRNITFPVSGYDRYVYHKGGYGYLFAASFDTISRADPWFFERVRESWERRFEAAFPRDVAGTLLGMTVGSVNLLSSEVKDAFIASGTAHILVVSGSNIAFLILFLSFFLKYIHIGRVARITCIVITVLGYIALVGAETSVVRAGIMGLISFLVVSHGWRASGRALLSLAGIILIVIEPTAPLYDAGFGLSFAATLGIIIFEPSISHVTAKWHFPNWLRETLALTLWASLGSLPVLIYHFERIPVAGIIANVIIAGVLSWILFTSIVYMGIGFLSSSLLTHLGLLVYLPTRFVIEVSRFFSSGLVLEIASEFTTTLAVLLGGMYMYIFLEDRHDV
jgi:ComEC/Rec2-related protein